MKKAKGENKRPHTASSVTLTTEEKNVSVLNSFQVTFNSFFFTSFFLAQINKETAKSLLMTLKISHPQKNVFMFKKHTHTTW